MDVYLREPRDLYRGKARCIVKPESPQDVAQVLALCNARGVGVTPQGGNTGLVGGQTPGEIGDEIVLSLQRLNRIRDLDPLADAMTLDAGVTLAQAQAAADSIDRYFPLSLASEGSCTIGGNLATNAGGVHVLAYGAARDLTLGIEVALADGRLMSTLSKLRKDNTGYDLTRLMIGSEGTLGVVTGATLRLFPRPRARATALVGLKTPTQALALLDAVKALAGPALQAFEILPRIGIELTLRHIANTRDPLPTPHGWYALIEIASFADESAQAQAAAMLARAHEAGLAQDAALAHSLDQAAALWALRENLSQAQKREGGSIKHDISVPVAAIPQFIEAADRRVAALMPDARPVAFGHMGDGNIHYNVAQPVGADATAFLARWDEVNAVVYEVVRAFEGSISAEHGVGRQKRDLLPQVKDPAALAMMRAIKTAFDPRGVLNPGKLL